MGIRMCLGTVIGCYTLAWDVAICRSFASLNAGPTGAGGGLLSVVEGG